MTREEGHAAARAKSTLPFTIIGTVARGAVPGGDRDVQLDRLVEDVGVAFWLIDDLIDLVADYRAGALNALLSETCGPLGPDGYDGGADGLARLLDDGPPERAAGEAAGRLADAVAIAAAEGDPGDRLAGVLTCTARDWST